MRTYIIDVAVGEEAGTAGKNRHHGLFPGLAGGIVLRVNHGGCRRRLRLFASKTKHCFSFVCTTCRLLIQEEETKNETIEEYLKGAIQSSMPKERVLSIRVRKKDKKRILKDVNDSSREKKKTKRDVEGCNRTSQEEDSKKDGGNVDLLEMAKAVSKIDKTAGAWGRLGTWRMCTGVSLVCDATYLGRGKEEKLVSAKRYV